MAWRSTRVVIGVVAAIAVLLILVDVRGAGPVDALRGVAGALAGPPERALSWARLQATDRLGGSAADRARIAELEEQLARSRADAGALAAGQVTEEQLQELAAQVPPAGYAAVPGRLVSVTAIQDPVRSVAVSVGSGDQVRPGLAVIVPGGLAGMVDSVSPYTATVRLVIDQGTQIAARVASSGEVGVFRGTGSAGRFELLDPLGDIAVDDLIVTLGAPGAQVPAGLALGRVVAVTGSSAALTRAAQVTPVFDDSTMDRVAVLVPDLPPEVRR